LPLRFGQEIQTLLRASLSVIVATRTSRKSCYRSRRTAQHAIYFKTNAALNLTGQSVTAHFSGGFVPGKAKQIEATPGAPSRNGDVLVPGYDVDGKLWTIQYIKEDGTKRFAKNSRKQGCFHVVGAPNSAAAIQKIAMSPVVVIAECYATAATLAEHGKVPTLAAYDSGNLLSVASSIHERWPDKAIVIAGDDDHKTENNPGREKALAAAEAVAGVAIFPNFSAEQRTQDSLISTIWQSNIPKLYHAR
jgi:putative DNA primase/helicase